MRSPMTEIRWLQDASLGDRLGFLLGKASDRQLRLLLCACCRRIWPSMSVVCCQTVETAERFSDGLVGRRELKAAHRRAYDSYGQERSHDWPTAAATIAASLPATGDLRLMADCFA